MFSDIKCIRVFILFGTCTLSRLEGRGSLSNFKNHIPSKKKGGVSACWTTTDRFQADITCSYSYEGSCRQLGSWTAGSCTFYSELVQSVEAQHRATFLHEKNPKQIKQLSTYLMCNLMERLFTLFIIDCQKWNSSLPYYTDNVNNSVISSAKVYMHCVKFVCKVRVITMFVKCTPNSEKCALLCTICNL